MIDRQTPKAKNSQLDELLVQRVKALIERFPTFGYRRLWAWLRFREGLHINLKAVYRVLRVKRWFVHQRIATPRPRVRGRRSATSASNQRWAMDVTHIPVGRDGWAHLAAVIGCCDREVIRLEIALRGRAQEAARALEEGESMVLRQPVVRRTATRGPVGRQTHLQEPQIPACLLGLPLEAGVRHAVHARA